MKKKGNISIIFIAEPQDDLFCFIPPSLAAKCEFYCKPLQANWLNAKLYRASHVNNIPLSRRSDM